MSRMSYLEKLLDGAEVEWSAVSDVFNLKNGYTPSKTNKEFWENGIIPWFRMDDIRENGQILNDSLQKVSKNAVKGGKLFPANSIIIATSATIGEHALITVPYLSNQRFTNLILKDEFAMRFDIKFLFYYCFLLADWCKKNTTMSSFASVDMDGFKKFQIPVPCPDNPEKSLAIQSEIVRILDTFTALTNELTNELKLREKQYSYYRDNLLNFNWISGGGGDLSGRSFVSDVVIFHRLYGDVEVGWKMLGEIGDVCMCKRIFKSQTSSKGDIPFYKIGTFGKRADAYISRGLFEEFKEKFNYPKVGDVLISASGTIGRTVIFDGEDSYFQDSNIVWIDNNENVALNKFLFYYYTIVKWDAAEGGTIQRLYNDNLKKTIIPIPCPDNPEKSLAIQSEIVRTLDAFSTLTHSISEGLPREIELRRKQYEYYRDLLLSFPRSIKSRSDNEG